MSKGTNQANTAQPQQAANTLSSLGSGQLSGKNQLADVTVDDSPKAAKAPAKLRVVDTTASHDAPRVHEVEINGRRASFTFKANEAIELDEITAAKFLKHPHFQLVDETGNVLPYRRPPRQPEELGAGEQLKLADDETVARFDELTSAALLKRVLAMPGGEAFGKNPDRQAIINHIIGIKAKTAKANAAPPEDGPDSFIPEAEADEAA